MRTLAVFDLDGVVADTRATVRAAYREVGVEMPDDAWGKPWSEWLVEAVGGDRAKAEGLHSQKTVEYRRLIRTDGVIELPAARVVRDMKFRAIVVTSSARSTALLILNALRIPKSTLGGAYLTLEHRVSIVKFWANAGVGSDGVYIDDLKSNGVAITEATNWPHHVVTRDTTLEEVREWTQ